MAVGEKANSMELVYYMMEKKVQRDKENGNKEKELGGLKQQICREVLHLPLENIENDLC